jgi:hypothetical protein
MIKIYELFHLQFINTGVKLGASLWGNNIYWRRWEARNYEKYLYLDGLQDYTKEHDKKLQKENVRTYVRPYVHSVYSLLHSYVSWR